MEARKEDSRKRKSAAGSSATPIAFKAYEFDAHGVEMNQFYASDAVVTGGATSGAFDARPGAGLSALVVPGRATAACVA